MYHTQTRGICAEHLQRALAHRAARGVLVLQKKRAPFNFICRFHHRACREAHIAIFAFAQAPAVFRALRHGCYAVVQEPVFHLSDMGRDKLTEVAAAFDAAHRPRRMVRSPCTLVAHKFTTCFSKYACNRCVVEQAVCFIAAIKCRVVAYFSIRVVDDKRAVRGAVFAAVGRPVPQLRLMHRASAVFCFNTEPAIKPLQVLRRASYRCNSAIYVFILSLERNTVVIVFSAVHSTPPPQKKQAWTISIKSPPSEDSGPRLAPILFQVLLEYSTFIKTRKHGAVHKKLGRWPFRSFLLHGR